MQAANERGALHPAWLCGRRRKRSAVRRMASPFSACVCVCTAGRGACVEEGVTAVAGSKSAVIQALLSLLNDDVNLWKRTHTLELSGPHQSERGLSKQPGPRLTRRGQWWRRICIENYPHLRESDRAKKQRLTTGMLAGVLLQLSRRGAFCSILLYLTWQQTHN